MLNSIHNITNFAFRIHTVLGCHCTGGRVNGKAVSFKEKLETGDVVEIMSSRNQRPTIDWLNYVSTSKARGKIKVELDADLRRQAAAGRELLQRRLRNWKLELKDDLVAEMMHYMKYTSVINFMADIGNGDIDVNTIKTYILNPELLVIRNEGEEEKKKEAHLLRSFPGHPQAGLTKARRPQMAAAEAGAATFLSPREGAVAAAPRRNHAPLSL